MSEEHRNSHSTRIVSASRIITGKPDEVIPDGSVVISDGNIEWVGATASIPVKYEAIVSDSFPLSTILPGLIETHAHLGARSGSQAAVPNPALHVQGWNALHSVKILRQLASVGITSVQSLGSKYYTDVAVSQAVEQGLIEGPRVVPAGPMITTTGGHDWHDGAEVDSINDIRHAVREHHKAGASVIKVAATGGFMTPGTAQWNAQFSTDELRVFVSEAHRLGKLLAVHAHGTEGIRRSVDAGVDYIAHATFISEDGTTRFDAALADRIAESGIYVDVASPPSFPPVANETIAPRAFDLFSHGVRIVTGHDIGAVIPAYGYLYGLEQLELAGIPRSEILIAATSRASAAIGLAGVAGVIESGYSADLLVVDGNPLDDLKALYHKQLILIRGKTFIPEEIPIYEGRQPSVGGPESVLGQRQAALIRKQLQQW
ncbi:MAG: amidohydrolase family protein [Bifidobacterium psychraerophilum]|uniref:amidohydrolase family protein n=1 Tax=Bifidobacterium psychraerophilum TaxID=218140 RepID=UPI0039EA0832